MGWIGLQTLVNLGAVTGLLPITGVPLPFLSFGGTALVVTLAGVGVVASVALDGVRSTERRHARSRSSGGTGADREGRDRRRWHRGAHHAVDRRRPPAPVGGCDRGVHRLARRAGGVARAGRRLPVPRRARRSRSAGRSRCDPPPRRSWRSVRSAAARPIVRDASVVLGMGGYASVAPVLAARSLRVPTVVHEQNAVPGLANRFLARIVTGDGAHVRRARAPGSRGPSAPRSPVCRSGGRSARSPPIGRRSPRRRGETLGLRPGRTTVLVTGGSQGALHLDRTIAGAIPLARGSSRPPAARPHRRRRRSRWSPTPRRSRWTSIVRTLPDPRSDGARARRRRRRRRPRRRQHDPRAGGLRHPVDPGALPARHRRSSARRTRRSCGARGAAQIVLDQELDPGGSRAQDRDARRRCGSPLGDGDGRGRVGHAGCRRAGGRARRDRWRDRERAPVPSAPRLDPHARASRPSKACGPCI